MKQWTNLMALALGSLMVVTACGGGNTDPGTGTETESATGGQTSTNEDVTENTEDATDTTDVDTDTTFDETTGTDGDSTGDETTGIDENTSDENTSDDPMIIDVDLDGVADDEDNCPAESNDDQKDDDGDDLGNACDDDADGDNLIDSSDDECPGTPFGEIVNLDGCGPSQLDDDNDGYSNAVRNAYAHTYADSDNY